MCYNDGMNRYRILLLAIVILAFCLGYFWHKENQLGELTYTTEKISHSTSRYQMDAEYPVFNGGFPSKVREEINTTISSFIKESVEASKKEFDDMVSDSTLLMPDSIKFAYLAKVYVKSDFKSLPYLNITFEIYDFAGGAHGITAIKSFVFDARNGKGINLSDIFEGDYLDSLSVLSFASLKEKDPNLEMYPFATDGLKPDKKNFETFSLQNDGLHIIFGDYQVGPYSSGRPEIVIPYAKLEQNSKPEFKKIIKSFSKR